MTDELTIAAAVIFDQDARRLLVRKRGTTAFMQPGGKIEVDELPATALVRELAEELDLVVAPDVLEYIGERRAVAANEPDTYVHAHVFRLIIDADVTPLAEIAEVVWLDDGHVPAHIELAPLSQSLLNVGGEAQFDWSG